MSPPAPLRALHRRVRCASALESSVTGLTVRTRTADGADVRVLLEVEASGVAESMAGHLAHALVVPGIEKVTRETPLDDLVRALSDSTDPPAARAAAAFEAAGGRLERVAVIAVEHLLVSPSADIPDPYVDGPD